MFDLYQEIDRLKTNLDNEECIINIINTMTNIKLDEELVNKIKRYHEEPSEHLKMEILKNKNIMKYRQLENEVNLLILEIKNSLNDIVQKGGCSF